MKSLTAKTTNTFLKLATICLTAVALTACGKMEQNPVKNYDLAGVPAQDRNREKKDTMTTLFSIDADSSLTFVQGEAKTVTFKTRLFFTDPEGVQYDVKLVDGPTNLGAQFEKTQDGSYVLRWNPKMNTLTSFDPVKKYRLELQFVLLPNSSPRAKSQFAGHYDRKEFEITLMKDSAQPIIDDTVKVFPGNTLNPDQAAKITFTAAAKGLDTDDSLYINVIPNPKSTSKELAQGDATSGIRGRPVRTKDLGIDSTGRRQFEYEVSFDARPFVDEAVNEIMANPKLASKFNKGEIPTVEALFAVEAVNKYNGMRSPEKIVSIQVNLIDQAGAAELASDANISIKAGQQSSADFFIRAGSARGIVSISAIEMGTEKASVVNGKAAINGQNLQVEVMCSSKGTQKNNNFFGCKTGGCYKVCRAIVNSGCDAAQGTQSLRLQAQSELGKSVAPSVIEIPVQIQGKASNCQPVTATVPAGGR